MTRAPLLLSGLFLLAACSLTHKPPPPAPALPKVVVAPQPVLPKPTATHHFEIDPNVEVVGYLQKTVIGKEDTLPDIARRFDVGYEEMLLANPGVDPWLPGVGREVVVPTQFVLPAAPHEGVVVNVAAMRIFYFPPHRKGEPQIVYTHPIGIGKVGWQTPEGTTKIIARQKDPVWTPPRSVRAEHAQDGDVLPAKIPAGPDNPLGAYEFRLDWPGYLIHGTNKPYGVGMRSSHGCMRLYPEDIAVFFDLIPIGTKVTVVNQPYLFGWRDGTLYLQAYAVLEDDKRDAAGDRKALLDRLIKSHLGKRIAAHDKEIDWPRVAEIVRKPPGVPVAVSNGAPGLGAALAGARLVENTIPTGSNWNGSSGLLIDEKTFRELLDGRNPPQPNASPAHASTISPRAQ
jgi:L,D-transpeptidase ErfK/SrfK